MTSNTNTNTKPAYDSESGSEHDSDYDCRDWELHDRLRQERKRRARLADATQALKSEKVEANDKIKDLKSQLEELAKAKSLVDRQLEEVVKGVAKSLALDDVQELRNSAIESIQAQGIPLPSMSEDTVMQDGESDSAPIDAQSELPLRPKPEKASMRKGKRKSRTNKKRDE